jgi:hypothetical protein
LLNVPVWLANSIGGSYPEKKEAIARREGQHGRIAAFLHKA